jgi:release factor glutamine methyltransferase
MFAMMTAKALYRHFTAQLTPLYGQPEAAQIAHIIFEKFAGVTRADLVVNPELAFDDSIQQALSSALAQLLLHVPVQYITGEAWFYKIKFKVSPAVLVPRPETEELVSAVIGFTAHKKNCAVLDIGTGSGCIPIAIRKNATVANITAIDVSESALSLAKENAAMLDAEVHFMQTDFLVESSWASLGIYDVIVSNPPYIPWKEKASMDKHVAEHEPHLALFVADERPLIFYEKIAAFGKEHLHKAGCIFMETHEDLAGNVAAHFTEQGYENRVLKDMSGKERIVTATHCR